MQRGQRYDVEFHFSNAGKEYVVSAKTKHSENFWPNMILLQKETKAKSYFAIDELITTLDKCSLFFTHKFCWIENRDIGKINCLKTKTKSTDLHNRGK